MAHILRSITIDADIGDVWDFLTDSAKIAQWLMPNTFQPRLHHEFTMDCPPGIGSGDPIQCKLLEFSPPKRNQARLVYTWIINDPRTETLLEINLIEVNGATRLDLVHSGWDDGESDLKSRHEMGWDYLLQNKLRTLLEN